MIESAEHLPIALSNDLPLTTDAAIESKIDEAIASLWSAHRSAKWTAKQTKLELQDIRQQLGERLWVMKSILVRNGRSGGWAAYLRSHRLPRATADRYVDQHQGSLAPAANRPTEAVLEHTVEDVKKLVQRLIPRLRRILTTQELVAEFLYQVVQQLAVVR
jgi:hypothetical protein